MLRSVSEQIEKYHMIPPGGRVLVALSGGADSVALLRALQALSHDVCAAHVNHGIRGAEAERDETFCRELCEALGVPFLALHTDVPALAEAGGTGLEETAREERYRLLEEARRQLACDCIATAHNAEDNGETLLLHLARGTGLAGLCGIPPVRGRVIRPLLSVSRREIEAYLASIDQPYVNDSTNGDVDYSRNRIRARVMPELAAINPGFIRAAERTARLLSEDEALLEELAADCPLTAEALLSRPRPLAKRALRRAYTEFCGLILSEEATERALDLCQNPCPSARAELPGCTLRREYDRLIFCPSEPETGIVPRELDPDGDTPLEEVGLLLRVHPEVMGPNVHNLVNSFYLCCDKIAGKLTVRGRQTGDDFQKTRRGHRKPLKKWLIDDKIPRRERDRLPVITDGTRVLAVGGYGADASAAGSPGRDCLHVEIFEI